MKRFRPRLPSPAMVIALVALFSSLGGVSYGLAKGAINGREVANRSLTGKDVKRNSIGGNAVKESSLGAVPVAGSALVAGGVSHFAAVNRDGELLARRGVLSGFQTSNNGDYKVVFDREIRNCAYMATLVNGTPVTGALRGQIGVGLAADDARALQIQTANAGGEPTSLPFHVAVLC
jgi:hypothetical protein